MNCCVAVCRRPAVVEVDFHRRGRWYPYCEWHGYWRGNLRWMLARSRLIARERS